MVVVLRGEASLAAAVRVAVVGLVHDHVWKLLEQFAASGRAELVAAVDPNAPLTERARRELGFQHALARMDDLWSLRPEAILCCTANRDTADVVEQAAAHGVPVMVEKPLAANLAQARRIAAAAKRVPVMCNWPVAWDANIRHALDLARGDSLGSLYTMRYRAAHRGPREEGMSQYFWSWLYDAEQNGAGALIDYCCYGSALAALVLGLPTSVTAVKGRLVKTDIPVEDNAIILMQYPTAFALAEACWTQAGNRPGGLQILGHRAGLIIEGGRLLRVDQEHGQGAPVQVPPLPEGERNGPEYFLHCLDRGVEPAGLVSWQIGLDAQRILEAGLLASRSGSMVRPADL